MNGLSREAHALIAEVGRADGPSAERRARMKRQLATRLAVGGAVLGVAKLASAGTGSQVLGAAAGLSGASAGAVGVTSAAGSALSLGTVALWMAGGMALGTATMVPVAVSRSSVEKTAVVSAAPAVRPAKLGTTAARTARGSTASPSNQDLPALPVDAVSSDVSDDCLPSHGAVEGARARARQAEPALGPAPVAVPSAALAPPPVSAAVGAETQLLESAQRELASGNGERALELLVEHERAFPAGALGEERMFARVIALCQMGRGSEARAAAEIFLRAAPRSPLVGRVRKSCAFAEERDKGETRGP